MVATNMEILQKIVFSEAASSTVSLIFIDFFPFNSYYFFKDLIYYVYNIPSTYARMPQEGARSHYKWL